ncbi:MAG TPA: amidohydrolase family protein [Candidatus Brocadiia bacterium]|nr:amidohydrolase family protein [Candidatus Brocadiia bacterium]
MTVIDIHEHVILKPGFMDPEMGGVTVTTAAELVEIADKNGIDKMVALPLTSPETFSFVQSNEEVFQACDAFPGRFIKFCNVDPRLKCNSLTYDFAPVLSYYKQQGARGLGELTANLWWDDPRVQNLLRGCEAVGLPVIFHIATHEYNTYGLVTDLGLAGLERALQRFPRLQLLGHSQAFWSEVSGDVNAQNRGGYPKGKVTPGGRVPELMCKYANLWGDLSAGSGFNAVSRDPEWGYDFFEEFQDRLLMGLDLCTPRNTECKLVNYMREGQASGKIKQSVFEKIMGKNAERLLGL